MNKTIFPLRSSDEQTATLPEQKQRTRRLPPFKVILHNDDVNTDIYVILVIQKLTPLEQAEAAEKTYEAHDTGQSVLLITNRERAELYVEQFASCGLTVTCEPDA